MLGAAASAGDCGAALGFTSSVIRGKPQCGRRAIETTLPAFGSQ